MLIPKRFWEPIQRGEVTVTFRRWARSQVVAGRVYRTAAGRLHVESVDVVTADQIDDADAVGAGYPHTPGDPVFRISFRHLDEPDPRIELANRDQLTAEDISDIAARLARLDRASTHGPWTRGYLEAIEANSERRAHELAGMFGRETQPFKVDVRKLKNLGLTISCPIGYRLSPRGEAYLAAVRSGQ